MAAPDLIGQEPPTAQSTGHTLFLKIELNVDTFGGKKVAPMTAVFAPDPKQLTTTKDVAVLLWFHGDKTVWSKRTGGYKGKEDHSGETVQDYLKIPECMLREFILRTKQRNFLLVVPTLGDITGGSSKSKHIPGGLLWNQGKAEAYLQQVLEGVTAHMKIKVSGPGNIVLAAHSGGGRLMGHMAQYFSGAFDKANEVWCFDCTYWGGEPFTTWARKGHSNPRLWVYSKGGKGDGDTGPSADEILTFSGQKAAATTNVEVLIDDYPKPGRTSSTNGFVTAYGGSPDGSKHYESIEKYFPQLVETSKNLKNLP
jgi:hypothetical protein